MHRCHSSSIWQRARISGEMEKLLVRGDLSGLAQMAVAVAKADSFGPDYYRQPTLAVRLHAGARDGSPRDG